jgi:2,4-dienoyl-CoA reductase-like NADH-dependent reductase (Old Yellow Enzyme family)
MRRSGVKMSRLLEPFEYKGLKLKNRIVMPPMCQ